MDDGSTAAREVTARPARSLAARLVVPLVSSSVAVVVGVVALMYGMARAQLAQQVEERGRFLLNAVRYASETKAGFGDLLRQVNALGGQRDVRLIVVSDQNTGRVVAATRRAWMGHHLNDGPGEQVADLAHLAGVQRSLVARHLPELGAVGVAAPTLLFTGGSEVSNGVVVVAIDLTGVETDLLRQTTLLALMVLLGVAASAGLSVFLVHRFVLTPARAMRQAVQRREEVPVFSDDELGAVSNALNRAFTAAETRRADLDVAAGRLGALVRQFPAGVLVEDVSRRVVLANEAYCELFLPEIQAESLIGQGGAELVAKAATMVKDTSEFIARVEHIVASANAVSGDELRLIDGRIVERAYQPIYADGELQGHLWVCREITAQIRDAEQLRDAKDTAEAATRAKADFLATMSHEIRTPLNGVVGMADILIEADLKPEIRDQVDIIRASGRHLLSLINDILDYSRIEAGRLQLEHIDFDPWAICEEVLAMQVPSARAKRLDLQLSVAPGLPPRLRGDPGRLKQILVNLTGNAVKFTSSGSVQLRVATSGSEKDPILDIHIVDSGIGIAPDVLPNLFKPFTQADSSTSRRFGGTGLGLAICKRLAELLGGTISVSSALGQGSIFRISLPYRRGGFPTTIELPPDLAVAFVKVVIDDGNTRELAIRCLDSLGIRQADAQHPATILLSDLPANEARAKAKVSTIPVVGIGPGEAKPHGWAVAVALPMRRVRLYDSLNAALSGNGTVVNNGLPRWPNARILVADDVAVNRIVVKRMLERYGITVDVVEEGGAAVTAQARTEYSLILMDCHMPVMDGFAATRAIASSGPHPPIIALTADSLEGDREKCLASGMDDYLAKPITSESLRSILERWLGTPGPGLSGRHSAVSRP